MQFVGGATPYSVRLGLEFSIVPSPTTSMPLIGKNEEVKPAKLQPHTAQGEKVRGAYLLEKKPVSLHDNTYLTTIIYRHHYHLQRPSLPL